MALSPNIHEGEGSRVKEVAPMMYGWHDQGWGPGMWVAMVVG